MPVTTSTRPNWVLPGEQWYAGQTQEQYEKSGGKLNAGFTSVLGNTSTPVTPETPTTPTPTPTSTPTPTPTPTPTTTPTTTGQYNNPAIKSRDLIIAGQPITVWRGSNQQSAMSYQIKPGDNLTKIAKIFNTTVDDILRANGLDPSKSVSSPIIPPKSDVGVTSTEEERAKEEARKAAEDKARAEALAQKTKELAEANTEAQKLSLQKQIQDFKDALGISDGKPVTPTYKSDYEALRSSDGLAAIETQINSLNKEMNDLEFRYKAGKAKQEDRLAPMDIIGSKQEKLKNQYESELEVLNNRKKTLVDEYNVKTNIVSDIMKFKEMDYKAATDEYNTKFNQAIQLQTLLMSSEEKANAEVNRQRDDARANLTVLQNMYKGQDYSTLDDSTKAQIATLEMKAGLPAGILESFMKENVGLQVDNMTTSYDANGNEVVSFWSKDNGGTLIKSITGPGKKTTNVENAAIKQGEFDTAKAFVVANSNKTDEELGAALRKDTTLLTDGDISSIIKSVRASNRYLSVDWFKQKYNYSENPSLLRKAANSAGFKQGGSWFFGAGTGDEGVNLYLQDIMKKVEEYRAKGMTDDEILKLFPTAKK